MYYLNNKWIRIILGLLTGGFITEMIKINSDDFNHKSLPDNSSLFTVVLGVVIYFILTFLVKRNNKNLLKNKFYFPSF